MEIAYRFQPGNVNLRACVAGRKRARNSSVRAEGRWPVQLADPPEDVIREKKQASRRFPPHRGAWRVLAFIYVDFIHAWNIVNDP